MWGGGGVTAKLKNTRNILRSTEFFLICSETATISSMDSSLSARAVALAAEQARPEAGAGAGLRDRALIGEGEPLGLLPPSVPFFTHFGHLPSQPPLFCLYTGGVPVTDVGLSGLLPPLHRVP